MNWIDFRNQVPTKQDEYLIAVRNKNKEDGIWLYETAFWNSESFERNNTWEDILYWCEIVEPENIIKLR